MRGSSVAMAAVVMVLLMMSGPATSQSVWAEILPSITPLLAPLWQNNELEFMGSTCFYSQRPTIRSWELYYAGDFSCPTWTKIKGSALTVSRSGVIIETIENFLNQAKDSGLVTEEEAKIWLEGYQKG